MTCKSLCLWLLETAATKNIIFRVHTEPFCHEAPHSSGLRKSWEFTFSHLIAEKMSCAMLSIPVILHWFSCRAKSRSRRPGIPVSQQGYWQKPVYHRKCRGIKSSSKYRKQYELIKIDAKIWSFFLSFYFVDLVFKKDSNGVNCLDDFFLLK